MRNDALSPGASVFRSSGARPLVRNPPDLSNAKTTAVMCSTWRPTFVANHAGDGQRIGGILFVAHRKEHERRQALHRSRGRRGLLVEIVRHGHDDDQRHNRREANPDFQQRMPLADGLGASRKQRRRIVLAREIEGRRQRATRACRACPFGPSCPPCDGGAARRHYQGRDGNDDSHIEPHSTTEPEPGIAI